MFALPLLIAALTPGQIFSGFTGSCWEAQMAGGSTDTHCFTGGDKLVMDVHKVRNPNGQVVYEGVTLYRTDGDKVVYAYYNSLGDLYPGTAERTGDNVLFAGDQTTWKLSGDAYDVVSPRGTVHFTRQKAAEKGL